ncbi:MAG: DUF6483 family protein [Oscillospiraceae bacterium]
MNVMFRDDFILRQIDMMIQVIAKLIFSKDNIDYEIEDENDLSSTDYIFIKVKELLAKNDFCTAEDILMDAVRENSIHADKMFFNLALWFYDQLNKKTDDQLEENNFSRDEITEGLNKVSKLYNIDLSSVLY